jgi:hypothetical protein
LKACTCTPPFSVFDDINAIEFEDDRFDYGEERDIIIGMDNRTKILYAVYARWRSNTSYFCPQGYKNRKKSIYVRRILIMSKIIQKEHTKDKPIDNSDIDFTKADNLTDEEIEERAKRDPDSLPFSEEELKKVKIKRRHKDNG